MSDERASLWDATFRARLLRQALSTDEIKQAVAVAEDAAIRADERRIMCDEKDATIERLTRRLQVFREAVWENLITVGDDGHTASGYGPEDIPDELLYDAIVDAS